MQLFSPLALIAALTLLLPGCAPTTSKDDPILNRQDGQAETLDFSDTYSNLTQHTFTFIGEDMDADLSPDGKTLLYASTANSRTPDIFTKPVNGKTYTQRTYHEGNDRFPRWSPDGQWIVFASDRSGNWDLYLMAAAPGPDKPVRLTRRNGDELHPSWSPDGKELCYNYFNSRRGEWEIWVLTLSDLSTRFVCDGFMPEWCPNAKRNLIVFQRYRERNLPWFGIWVVNPEPGRESEQTAIVTESKWAAINPSWSPDGKRIIFATVYKGREAKQSQSLFYADDLWVVDVNGDNQQQLTNDAFPEWNPWWSRDGRIYFTREINGNKNIWSFQPKLLQFGSDDGDGNMPLPGQPMPSTPDPRDEPVDGTEDYYVQSTHRDNAITMPKTGF